MERGRRPGPPAVALPAARIALVDGVVFFLVEVTPAGGTAPWEVRRRYSDFVDLRKRLGLLEDSFPHAPFPPKLIFLCAGDRLEARRHGLEVWLRELLKEPTVSFRTVAQPLFSFLADAGGEGGGLEEACSLFPEPRSPTGSRGGGSFPVPVLEEAEAQEPPALAPPTAGCSEAPAAQEESEEPGAAPLAVLRRRLSGLGRRMREAGVAASLPEPLVGRRRSDQRPAEARPASFSLPCCGDLPSPARARLRHSFTAILPSEVERAPAAGQEAFAECARLISRDIPRTFHGNPSVDRIRLQVAEVLRSYAQSDPELGYTQGMCFAAAAICLKSDSLEAASASFGELMGKLRGLWLPGFPLVVRGIPLFQAMLEERDPEVLAHLMGLGLDLGMVLPKAWLTLLARWLPLPNLLEALPFLMREGLTGMLAISLLLLLFHRWFLLRSESLEEALLYLGSLPSRPPPDRLIDMSTVALPGLRARVGNLSS